MQMRALEVVLKTGTKSIFRTLPYILHIRPCRHKNSCNRANDVPADFSYVPADCSDFPADFSDFLVGFSDFPVDISDAPANFSDLPTFFSDFLADVSVPARFF